MNYRALILILIITVACCIWPDFHPENYIGMKYHWLLDMCFHGFYYFLITILLAFLFLKHTTVYILYIIIFGISLFLEIIQLWIPDRTFSLLDICSNTIGITVGLFANKLIQRLS